MKFTWVAFEHKNPSLWYMNHLPYTAAGTVAASGSCQTINFASALTSVPQVQVLANHKSASSDFSSTSGQSTTSISSVTTSGFQVCTSGSTAGMSYDYAVFAH